MADEIDVNLIVKALAAGFPDLVSKIGGVEQAQKLYTAANKDANGALQTFGVNLSALNSPLTLIAQGIKSSIDTTIQWGETVDGVSRILGTGAREASTLTVVLNDFGISSDKLKVAAKSLKDEGLTPNIATLRKLSEQYQAIQDPAARTAWGTKTLGKAYFDLSEVLEKTPAEWDAVTAAAQRSGKVVGDEFVKNAQAAKLQMAQLNDQLQGLEVEFGGPLVDGLSKAITAGQQYVQIMRLLPVWIDKTTGAIDENTARMRTNAIVGADLNAGLNNVTDASDRAATAQRNLGQATEYVSSTDMGANDAARALALATQQQADAADRAKATAELAAGSLGDLTEQMLIQKETAGLDADATLELERSLGLVNTTSYNTIKAIQAANAEYQKTGDLEKYKAAIAAINAEWRNTPSHISTTYEMKVQREDTQSSGATSQYVPAPNAPAQGQTPGKTTKGAAGFATGGAGIVPPGFPNDSYLVGLTSGEPFVVGKSGQSLGMGDVNILPGAVVVQGAGMNVDAIVDQIAVKLGQKIRAKVSAGAGYAFG